MKHFWFRSNCFIITFYSFFVLFISVKFISIKFVTFRSVFCFISLIFFDFFFFFWFFFFFYWRIWFIYTTNFFDMMFWLFTFVTRWITESDTWTFITFRALRTFSITVIIVFVYYFLLRFSIFIFFCIFWFVLF